MPVSNGDSSGKHTAVVAGENGPSRERSETPVLHSQKEHTQGSHARRALRDHPRKALAGFIILLVVVAGAVHFIRDVFVFESTDDAQVDGHLNGITARIDGEVKAVYV